MTTFPFIRTSTASVLAVLIALFTFAPSARVEAKPPPPGSDGDAPAESSGKKKPPVTDTTVYEQATKVDEAAVEAFKKAYKGAGRPKMLFLVGMDRRTGGPGGDPGRGNIASGVPSGPGIGGNLASFDNTGITEVLENGMGAIINDDGRVRMVDLEALADKDKRELATLKQNDEEAAIDSMARKINAELVLYIKFTPTPPGARGVNNVAYRCISELKNVVTATKVPLIPFDWDGPIDNQNARRYSVALSNVFCERFAKVMKAAGGLRAISVKIVQLPEAISPTALRKIIRKIDGVDGNVDLNSGKSSDGGTEATFEFELDGDIADFQEEFLKKVSTDFGVKLSVANQDKNNLILSGAGGGVSDSMPDWFLITDPRDNPIKDRFTAAYKKNPLKVAVIINWLVDPRQMGWIAQSQLPLIVMQGDPRINNLPLGPASIELERLSSQITPMFTDLGVRVVNSSKVQSILAAQGAKAQELHNDHELAVLLGSASAADVVVMGLATQVAKSAANIPYDFKLTNCNSGDLVGSLTWPVDERILRINPRNKRLLAKEENRTRFIAGQMLLAIERSLGGGKIMTAEIRHATDLASVQRLVDSLKSVEEITTDGARFDNGLGTFTIRYSGPYEDISPRITNVVDSLKLKVIEVNPSALRIDNKPE